MEAIRSACRKVMLYRIGRVMQFAGLIVLPIAMAGEVTGNHDLKWMLTLVAGGGVLFLVGWLMQQSGKPQ